MAVSAVPEGAVAMVVLAAMDLTAPRAPTAAMQARMEAGVAGVAWAGPRASAEPQVAQALCKASPAMAATAATPVLAATAAMVLRALTTNQDLWAAMVAKPELQALVAQVRSLGHSVVGAPVV